MAQKETMIISYANEFKMIHFIIYVNQKNISYSSKILNSIYETNPIFLDDKFISTNFLNLLQFIH